MTLPHSLIDSNSLNLPQWVQAIGSIAAIFIAIWLARSSRRRRVHAALLEEARFVEFVRDRTIEALVDADKIYDLYVDIFNEFVFDPVNFPYNKSRPLLYDYRRKVGSKLIAISKLPLESWPNPELYIGFKHAYWHFDRMFAVLDEYYDLRSPPSLEARYSREEGIYGAIQLIANDYQHQFGEFLETCKSYTNWYSRQNQAYKSML